MRFLRVIVLSNACVMSACVLHGNSSALGRGNGRVVADKVATGSSAGSDVSPPSSVPPPSQCNPTGTPAPLAPATTVASTNDVVTALPPLPALTNVVGTLREDSVGIDFDPVDDAVDYRVYVLPADADITAYEDGSLTVQNALYRCAGLRQTFDMKNNLNGNDSARTTYSAYAWGATIAADDASNTLGYVFMSAAADRIPVYAAAGHAMDDEQGWQESRLKIYTTVLADQQQRIAQGWRDDGVVFYVPAAASGATRTIYGSQTTTFSATHFNQAYFTAANLTAHQNDKTPPAPAFQVLTAAAADSVPLMATAYTGGEQEHTELSPGKARFLRAAYEGNSPLWHLEWSGITGPATLVVEALANGCPFQGFLSPEHLDAQPKTSGSAAHQAFLTLADVQTAASVSNGTGEVFINGEYDNVVGRPKPIARSFLTVMPVPHDPSAWDWHQGFTSDLGAVTEIADCTDMVNCDHWQTRDFDVRSYRIDAPNGERFVAWGEMLGQLWTAFSDYGQDVTGKMRFTVRQKATVDCEHYLHATMSVNIVTTDRRYPQMIISDQSDPVQESFKNPDNNSLLLQPILGPSLRVEIQAFHGLVPGLIGSWDVNNQAPEHRLIDYSRSAVSQQPAISAFEHAGMDRLTKFDLFLSSQRAYVFVDDEPAGCTMFPDGFAMSGAVTYTVGDVLYHEGAPDELVWTQARPFSFLHAHQVTETKRHFDDLGFKSGVPPPAWDDVNFPCLPY